MRSLKFCLYFIAISFCATISSAQEPEVNLETLKLVQLIFRHGDRVPEYPWPLDPFSDPSIWPEGWAQMTDEGKQQEYQLGQYLRGRYGNYLNSIYRPNQVYTISSDTDRTIMSALLVLAGMYPTNNESNWNNSINWQPVPIRTIFREQDNLIRMKRKCPRYTQIFEDFLRNYPLMKRINEENQELYRTLSQHTGVNITTIDDIDAFYATLSVEEYKGLDIPEWAKSLKNDQNFQYLYNLSFQAKTYTPELKRLRAGPLLNFLMDNVNERVRNASSTTKMVMLSGHDITLIDALNTFGMLDLQKPWYSSVLMIELHQQPNGGNYFVEFHFRNDTSRAPYRLNMTGCQFQCPLDRVLNYTHPLIPDQWEAECKLQVPQPEAEGSSMFTYILIGVGIIAVGIFLVGLACMALKKKKRNILRNEYQNF